MKTNPSQAKRIFNLAILFTTAIVLFAACTKDHNDNDQDYDIVYVETNDFHSNANAVLAYRDNGNGHLTQIQGSPFLTHGSGLGNPMQMLGPADSDYELRLSSDKKFLLAVNSGSNTIAVFRIANDGALEHVPGSPFPSGGETPVCADVSGNNVFVVNKSQNPLNPTTTAPNYVTFKINNSGQLTQVPGSKFNTRGGSSPSQALASRDGKFLFGDDFLAFMLMPAAGTLRSFTINSSGTFLALPGTPYVLPNGPMPPDNGALGLYQHPSGNPLYVGMPLQGKVGVFSVNAATGALALYTTVPAGKAACWIRTNAAGNHMYVLNSGDNTVQVYNTSNAMSPVSIQTLELKNSGPSYPGPGGAMFKTSEDFSLHLSTNEKILYVVNQHTNKDFSIGNYNYLHSLKVAADGTLNEITEPVQLPVPNTIRPKGSAVINISNRSTL